jgi:hypothetical protein
VPFLRVSRDKRGIETTALLHSSRRQGKGRPRLLYWFRTPPDVLVGREPIDEGAITQLERAHPDISFDWPQILHASKSLAAAGARRDREEKREPARAGRPPGGARRRRKGAAAQPEDAAGAQSSQSAAAKPEADG